MKDLHFEEDRKGVDIPKITCDQHLYDKFFIVKKNPNFGRNELCLPLKPYGFGGCGPCGVDGN